MKQYKQKRSRFKQLKTHSCLLARIDTDTMYKERGEAVCKFIFVRLTTASLRIMEYFGDGIKKFLKGKIAAKVEDTFFEIVTLIFHQA